MSTLFFVLMIAGAGLPIFAPLRNRRVERRMFWVGFVVATSSAFLICYPPDWRRGGWISLFVAVFMLFKAYTGSSNIKIRGKIYAFDLSDSQPDPSPDGSTSGADDPDYDPAPDSYGRGATAQKFWWLLVVVACMWASSVVIGAHDGTVWMPLVMTVISVVFAAFFGHQDASWGYPIARGQRLQLVVASVITAGTFAVVYLAGYRLGVHRPLRRKQSMEYVAHPHLRKKYPYNE